MRRTTSDPGVPLRSTPGYSHLAATRHSLQNLDEDPRTFLLTITTTMKLTHVLFALLLASFFTLSSRAALAADDPLDFLHALQDNGFSDVAVDYLKAIKEQPDGPKQVLDVWNLEMSRSLRAASKSAYSEADAKRDMDNANKYLEKFIAENPKRPEAIEAAAWWADVSWRDAAKKLSDGLVATDKAEKAKLLEAARKTFQDVRPRFVQAGEQFKSRLKSPPKLSGNKLKDWKENQEAQIIETRLKIAVTDFYTAQAYEDRGAERTTILNRASKEFDGVFQAYRGTIWGLIANYWHARVLLDEGKTDKAKDIFEEVLAADLADMPDATGETATRGRAVRRKATGFEEFFSEVEQYYLQCILKTSAKEYLAEAVQWRTTHKELCERLTPYQAISFELAKYLHAHSKDSSKYLAAAIKILQEMIKIPSPYQKDAIEMLRKLRPGGGTGPEAVGECIVDGDDFAKKKQWSQAIAAYQKAIEVAAKPGSTVKKEQTDQLRNAIAACFYNVAHEAFSKGKLDKSKEALGQIMQEYKDTATARTAATLMLTIALNEYAEAPEGTAEEKKQKEELEKGVIQASESLIKAWPDKAEADFARLAILRIKIIQNKMDEAVKLLREINPKSDNYSTAFFLVSYSCWRSYRIQKKAIEEKLENHKDVTAEEKAARDAMRVKAVAGMDKAVDIMKSIPSQDPKMAKMYFEGRIIRAEMAMEGADPKSASAQFQALADEARKNNIKTLDESLLRVFNGGVNAYLQLDEMDKAADLGKTLLELGPDDAHVNIALMNFAKRLESERKKLVQEAENAVVPSEATKFRDKAESFGKLLADVLSNLGKRIKVSPQGAIWVAQTSAAVGLDSEAEKLIQTILEKFDSDDSWESAKKAIPRLQSILIGIKVKKGKYDEAAEEADRLMKEHPRALEPKMLKGDILQQWAKKDPEKYADAFSHWEKLRRGLEAVKPNPRNPYEKLKEFYDVTYNEAQCLYDWAKKSGGDKQKAETARKILQQLMDFDPKFKRDSKQYDSQTLLRFTSLRDKVEILLGMEPTSKKKPAPAKKEGASKAA